MIPGHVQHAQTADPSAHICRHTPGKGAHLRIDSTRQVWIHGPPPSRKEKEVRVGFPRRFDTCCTGQIMVGTPPASTADASTNRHDKAMHWPGGTSVTSEHIRRLRNIRPRHPRRVDFEGSPPASPEIARSAQTQRHRLLQRRVYVMPTPLQTGGAPSSTQRSVMGQRRVRPSLITRMATHGRRIRVPVLSVNSA